MFFFSSYSQMSLQTLVNWRASCPLHMRRYVISCVEWNVKIEVACVDNTAFGHVMIADMVFSGNAKIW